MENYNKGKVQKQQLKRKKCIEIGSFIMKKSTTMFFQSNPVNF